MALKIEFVGFKLKWIIVDEILCPRMVLLKGKSWRVLIEKLLEVVVPIKKVLVVLFIRIFSENSGIF